MRRAIACMLAVLFSSAALPVTCLGWSTSAAARMACCQRAHHAECAHQSAANTCCARQEQSRPILLFSGVTAQTTPIHQSPLPHALPPATHWAVSHPSSVGIWSPQVRAYRPPGRISAPLRI